jgi:hypothetical protein
MEENNMLNISQEMLDSLSVEEIADLKVEVDDLLKRLDDILEDCNEEVNS